MCVLVGRVLGPTAGASRSAATGFVFGLNLGRLFKYLHSCYLCDNFKFVDYTVGPRGINAEYGESSTLTGTGEGVGYVLQPLSSKGQPTQPSRHRVRGK